MAQLDPSRCVIQSSLPAQTSSFRLGSAIHTADYTAEKGHSILGATMLKAAEYKYHAQECRELAERMLRPEDSDAFEQIAHIWERLANVRESHPEPVSRQ